FWRSSRPSRESGLGWVGTFSTGELAVVSEAGNKAAPVPEGLATDETIAACAFDTLAVCATSAKGTASGSTRKPPDGWYRSRKSTFAEFGPSPRLTRRKHQLHDPRRPLIRYRVRIPSRLFVDDR